MLDVFIEMIVHLFAWIGVNLSIEADKRKNKYTLEVIDEVNKEVKETDEYLRKKEEENIRRKYGD